MGTGALGSRGSLLDVRLISLELELLAEVGKVEAIERLGEHVRLVVLDSDLDSELLLQPPCRVEHLRHVRVPGVALGSSPVRSQRALPSAVGVRHHVVAYLSI